MNQAQNTFEGGLMMDFHPLTVPNTMTTNCLNGTYLTYNGNEYMIQNDMGNGKVETAALPAGYIPLGTTSFGGIIYIVSYNPLKDVCQIGCFPSPERNFSYEELKEDGFQIHSITESDFKNGDNIISFKTKVELTKLTLNPGDKFLITSDLEANADRITDYKNNSKKIGDNPKFLRLHVATKDSSGRLVYLDSSLKWYKFEENKYYYIPKDNTIEDTLTASKYSIFNSKLSGNLYLIAELETISMFSSTYTIDDNYNLILNLEWKSDNWNETQKGIDPKYINFEADNFQLTNNNVTSDKFSLEVYNSEHDTVGGDIEGRYPDIKIDLQNKVNTKSIFCGQIPTSLIDDNAENVAKNFKLTPAMEFGALPTFELSQNINFAQIGSGRMFIDEWRYFKQDDSLILTYGFQDYPKPFYKTFEVSLHFMTLDSFQSENPDIFQIKNIGKISYAGSFTTELEFDTLFEENKLYIVKITKKSGLASSTFIPDTEELIGYRFLYTTDFFNDSYISDIEDFNDLYLPEGILNSGLTITSTSKNETQTNKLYSDSDLHDETDFYSDKCIVRTTEPTPIYTYATSHKKSKWTGISAKADLRSNYPLFNTFNCLYKPTGPDITKKSGEGTFNNDTKELVIENELKLGWGYSEQTVQYQHGLVPLIYELQDGSDYGLNFDPIYKHFAFGTFSFLTNMGHIREGSIDFCPNNAPAEEAVSEDITNSQYWVLDPFDTEGENYYRHNGNQCYAGSQFQVHFNEYAKTKDNFIPTSFVNSNYDPSHDDTKHRNRNAMDFIDSITGADFYWYGSPKGAHITTAKNGDKGHSTRYTDDGKGKMLYSDNIGLYENNDGREGMFSYQINNIADNGTPVSQSNFVDTNGNIRYDDSAYDYDDIPVVTVMIKAVDKNGDSLHLFTNNFSIITPYKKHVQALPTANANISFGDIFGMFLMQTYKYVTEDLEEDFICPDDIEVLDETNKSSDCILEVKSEIKIDNFNIDDTDRNQLLETIKSLQGLNPNNLKFEIETHPDKYLEINDSVTFSSKADDTVKDSLSVKTFDKNVLVKNCKGQIFTLPKTKALNESHIYGIKNNSEYTDLSSLRLTDYNDYYKLLDNISYNEQTGILTYNGYLSENGSEGLQPSCVDILKLDENKTLVIDLDKYKRIANRSWAINNCGRYSMSKIQGISSKFSFSKLLNVLR